MLNEMMCIKNVLEQPRFCLECDTGDMGSYCDSGDRGNLL